MSGYAGITSGSSVEPSGLYVVTTSGLSVGAWVISGISGSATSGGGVPESTCPGYSGAGVPAGYSGAGVDGYSGAGGDGYSGAGGDGYPD